jgi:hypothetical protein
LVLIVLLAVAAAAGAFENDEYGLRATIPTGYPECVANTQGHVHGIGTVLVGRDCENDDRHPAFNVWADYNTAEYPDALAVLRSDQCTGARLRWADDEWKNAISGLKTAVCRVNLPNGDVELTLAAQAATWPKGSSITAPRVNYTVNFASTKLRLDQDLQVLKRFVRSIRIRAPRG